MCFITLLRDDIRFGSFDEYIFFMCFSLSQDFFLFGILVYYTYTRHKCCVNRIDINNYVQFENKKKERNKRKHFLVSLYLVEVKL